MDKIDVVVEGKEGIIKSAPLGEFFSISDLIMWINRNNCKGATFSLRELGKKDREMIAIDRIKEEKMESVREKMNRAYNLALDCEEISEHSPEDESDVIWSYLDGLFQKRLLDTINGKCSLAATLAFNMDKVEKQIDGHIEMMERIIKEG